MVRTYLQNGPVKTRNCTVNSSSLILFRVTGILIGNVKAKKEQLHEKVRLFPMEYVAEEPLDLFLKPDSCKYADAVQKQKSAEYG